MKSTPFFIFFIFLMLSLIFMLIYPLFIYYFRVMIACTSFTYAMHYLFLKVIISLFNPLLNIIHLLQCHFYFIYSKKLLYNISYKTDQKKDLRRFILKSFFLLLGLAGDYAIYSTSYANYLAPM